jgi:hypothetical protein
MFQGWFNMILGILRVSTRLGDIKFVVVPESIKDGKDSAWFLGLI